MLESLRATGLMGASLDYSHTYLAKLFDEVSLNDTPLLIADPNALFDNTTSIEIINKVVAFELLERCYFAAATGFIRMFRWLEAIDLGAAAGNLPSFASATRGFLESSCDLCYSLAYGKSAQNNDDTLVNIAKSLASNKALIDACLSGTYGQGLIIYETLENALLHFQFAEKNSQYRDLGRIYNPQTIKEYIEMIDAELYRYAYTELCSISHPSARSLDSYIGWDEHFIPRISVDDQSRILLFSEKYADRFEELFCKTTNTIVILLKVINLFGLEGFYTDTAEYWNTNNIPLWTNIMQILGKSARGA